MGILAAQGTASVNDRRYQIALFERETPDDDYIYGVIRWHGDGSSPVLLGMFANRESAIMTVRRQIEYDHDRERGS